MGALKDMDLKCERQVSRQDERGKAAQSCIRKMKKAHLKIVSEYVLAVR